MSLAYTFHHLRRDPTKRCVQCRAMLAEEKADLSKFGAASRQRVASEVGCTITQVRKNLRQVVSLFYCTVAT